MDKEQAIDLLDNLIGMVEDNQDNDYDTAFRMAIDALKAQLSQEDATSDCISRQAALDIFDDYNISVENGELEAYSRDRKRLCELPPAERTGHWIWDAGDLVCSECGTRYSDLYPDYDESVACPHCGAHMTGGESE